MHDLAMLCVCRHLVVLCFSCTPGIHSPTTLQLSPGGLITLLQTSWEGHVVLASCFSSALNSPNMPTHQSQLACLLLDCSWGLSNVEKACFWLCTWRNISTNSLCNLLTSLVGLCPTAWFSCVSSLDSKPALSQATQQTFSPSSGLQPHLLQRGLDVRSGPSSRLVLPLP